LRIQRVQCVAIAHTDCSVHRHCVYRVLIVSPIRIQSVHFIASAYTGCSMYRPALHRVLLYSFFNIGSRWDGWLTPRPGRFPFRNDSVPTVQEAWWDPRPVCTGTENLVSIGIRLPDRQTRSESLYRLSYPGTSSFIYLLLFRPSFFHFTPIRFLIPFSPTVHSFLFFGSFSYSYDLLQ
jgi:hypothetical protein